MRILLSFLTTAVFMTSYAQLNLYMGSMDQRSLAIGGDVSFKFKETQSLGVGMIAFTLANNTPNAQGFYVNYSPFSPTESNTIIVNVQPGVFYVNELRQDVTYWNNTPIINEYSEDVFRAMLMLNLGYRINAGHGSNVLVSVRSSFAQTPDQPYLYFGMTLGYEIGFYQ